MSFDMIKQIVSYVESMYPDITKKYQITTNGTLITNEISDFMEKYNFNIMISIDGDRAKHNKYRCFKNGRGSYDNVVKGINFINNKYLLNARITVTDINPEIYEYIDDILNLSIQRVTFAIDYKVSEDVFIKYIDAIKKLASKYINDIKNGIFYDITNLTRVMSYAIFHNKCRAHCNAGVSYITMSADGLYYQCPRFVGMSNFCMGENSLSVSNYMNKLNKNLGSSAADRCMDCKNCNFVYVCGGVCMHHAYVSHGGIFDKVKRECVERTVVFQEGLRVLCSLSVSERRAFLLFLTSIWQKNNIKGGDG